MEMRCLIVDDEEMSRTVMQAICSQIEGLNVVGMCSSAMEAVNFLRRETVDILFLDIEMPDMTGLDLVRTIPDLPHVVFVTSKKEYAVEAFEHRVSDYISKPAQLPRVLKAVERVRDSRGKQHIEPTEDIFIKVDGRLVRVDLKEVLYIESLGDYVVFNTEKKEKLIVHSTLKNIDETITHPRFLKVHRSFIINVSKIVDIQETNLLIRDKVIPISRAHRPILMNAITTI